MNKQTKIARIYCRVSTVQQDLTRQMALREWAEQRGYYVAKVYAEKASGRTAERAKLTEMIEDLQEGEVVVIENIDRLTRLPVKEAEKLVGRIKAKGARLAMPGVVDLDELYPADSMAGIVMEAVQNLLLKIAMKSASDDYELRRERQAAGFARARAEGRSVGGRRIDQKRIDAVAFWRQKGLSIAETAKALSCSPGTVKRIWRKIQAGEYRVSGNKLPEK
ncbi:recombinase family protein [Eikenella halliae]|uniref:Resolvase n=1 Tax=Eikenella halliae TaxID=1795832 RepID=A0A1B6VZA3_9NEIS|nr:recombinase family protein [Eikenella halliae]OAM43542.1 resolvase [Eikenella halliae]